MGTIPLKVLVVDPDSKTSARLSQALGDEQTVISASAVGSLDAAREFIIARDINAVYLDPLLLKIASTDEFIKRTRQERPEIVYVLYMRFPSLGDRDQNFAFGHYPFRMYFKLDKDTSKDIFAAAVRRSIEDCQRDLSSALTKTKIESLQEELHSLRRISSDDSVSIPLGMLRDIQEQLSARKQDVEERSRWRSAEFLGHAGASLKERQCFVVMPYSESWSEGVESILRTVCQGVGLEILVAKSMDGRFIPNDIWQGITGSGIILADLTGGNPNVAYEVGLADALGREVILICQHDQVPFDFSGQRLILYKDSIPGSLQLQDRLKERLARIKDKSTGSTRNAQPYAPADA